MSLRAIQKRDRNKLSSTQQKQHLFINKSRSFGGGPTGIVVSGSTGNSVGASATGGHHHNSHHHHHHHQHSSKNEKWRNSSTVSISSTTSTTVAAAAGPGLTHKKRSVSYPSLQKRSTTHSSSSSSLRFTKSESDLHSGTVSPGGTATNDADVDTNNLYLGAKSEVCLRTLAVKSTHQPPAPFGQGSTASNATSGAGGANRQRMYESSRRPSEIGSELGRADKYAGINNNNNNVAVRIPIIGYEVMEERARFTIFKLRIENSISHTCWLVLRRYTDFVRLNNKLRSLFPHCTLILPRKKWFGDNFSSGFIDNRIQGLQTFINTIMGDDAMRTSPVVREFFCLDEPPSYSESMEESRIIFEAQEETISHLKQQLQTKDELISALQAKLANEMSRNKVLSNVVRNSFENCPKCAKQIDNHLKESAFK